MCADRSTAVDVDAAPPVVARLVCFVFVAFATDWGLAIGMDLVFLVDYYQQLAIRIVDLTVGNAGWSGFGD